MSADGKTARQKFMESDLVIVDQLDGQMKVVKNRYGSSCSFIEGWNYETFLRELHNTSARATDLKVWRLGYHEARSLLAGLVAL